MLEASPQIDADTDYDEILIQYYASIFDRADRLGQELGINSGDNYGSQDARTRSADANRAG